MSSFSPNTLLSGRGDLFKNPLFSLSDLYEPKSIYEVFSFCRKIVLTNEVVSAILHKLAESPITDLLYEHEDEEVKKKFTHLFENKINIRERFFELIFDLVTYSNAFVSYEVPVTRFLVSPEAAEGLSGRMKAMKSGKLSEGEFDGWLADKTGEGRNHQIPKRYRIQTIDWSLGGNNEFQGICPTTGKKVTFQRVDRYYASADNVGLKRWDPNLIEIVHNEITGKNKYYYKMSKPSRELIRMADRDMLNEIPWAYVEAVRLRRNVRIQDENFRHLSNVRVSGAFNGWGVPRLYSAFRMIFYYMTLLRANQSIAVGKIHDLNILFPATQGSSLGIDPAGVLPGSNFAGNVHKILKAHQKDPNFTGISPIPVGVTSVFGQGRMQLVSNELEPVTRAICSALGLPYDMLYGGGAFTGQAVAQRLFSAQTGLTRERFNELLTFIVGRSSVSLGPRHYPDSMTVRLRPDEGPDASQLKQTIVNMALNGHASRTAALEQVGLEWETEAKRMEDEASALGRIRKLESSTNAFAQARGEEVLQRAQMRLQQEQVEMMAPTMAGQEGAMGAPQGAAAPGGPEAIAEVYLDYIEEHPEAVDSVMQMAQTEHPEAFEILMQMIQGGAPSMEMPSMEMPPMEQQPVMMSPQQQAQPEGLPPRREMGGL
jgi:hypothetical protein